MHEISTRELLVNEPPATVASVGAQSIVPLAMCRCHTRHPTEGVAHVTPALGTRSKSRQCRRWL